MKLPIRSNKSPVITQGYGNTSNNAWYLANGINLPSHNGTDLVIASPEARDTYGTELVCPFPNAVVVKINWDSPMSTKGNGVTIESSPFDFNGKQVVAQVVFWHTGEIKVQAGQQLKEGDVICYIGNSGLCNPPPTKEFPWRGAHLHLMLFLFTQVNGLWTLDNSLNGLSGAVDPMSLFRANEWYRVETDSDFSHDEIPIIEMTKNMTWIEKFKYLLTFYKGK